MELDYHITGSLVSTSLVKDKWLYNASAGTGAFNSSKNALLTGSSSSDDFSLFFTFNKANSTRGILLSNYAGSLNSSSGIVVGFTDNNEIFASTHGNGDENKIFHDVRLGQKNCLGLVKNGNYLNLYKYDIISSGIESFDSHQFSSSSNLVGTQYSVGLNSNYASNYGISGISGSFDQLVYFNDALSLDSCKKIFSGFLPITYTGVSSYALRTTSEQINYGEYNTFINQFYSSGGIKDVITYIASGSLPTALGSYISTFSGNATTSLDWAKTTGAWALASDMCVSTGSLNQYINSGTFSLPGTGIFTYSGNVIFSTNSAGERMLNFAVKFNSSISTGVDYVYHDIYQTYTTGTSYTTGIDYSYNTGFFMDGVVTTIKSGITLLAYVSGETPSGFNFEANFDRVENLFKVEDWFRSGRVYYGESGIIYPTGFVRTGSFIDLLNISENSSYDLIYDAGQGVPIFLQTTLSGYATGRINPHASLVFTGISSWEPLQRVPFRKYWETCSLHMAHAKGFYYPRNTYEIYDNNEEHWE